MGRREEQFDCSEWLVDRCCPWRIEGRGRRTAATAISTADLTREFLPASRTAREATTSDTPSVASRSPRWFPARTVDRPSSSRESDSSPFVSFDSPRNQPRRCAGRVRSATNPSRTIGRSASGWAAPVVERTRRLAGRVQRAESPTVQRAEQPVGEGLCQPQRNGLVGVRRRFRSFSELIRRGRGHRANLSHCSAKKNTRTTNKTLSFVRLLGRLQLEGHAAQRRRRRNSRGRARLEQLPIRASVVCRSSNSTRRNCRATCADRRRHAAPVRRDFRSPRRRSPAAGWSSDSSFDFVSKYWSWSAYSTRTARRTANWNSCTAR